MKKYILHGREILECDDLTEWSKCMLESNRIKRDVMEDVRVSTVFLGFDHEYKEGFPPKLFESMVFGGEYDGFFLRCSTYDEAIEQHEKVLAKVRGKECAVSDAG